MLQLIKRSLKQIAQKKQRASLSQTARIHIFVHCTKCWIALFPRSSTHLVHDHKLIEPTRWAGRHRLGVGVGGGRVYENNGGGYKRQELRWLPYSRPTKIKKGHLKRTIVKKISRFQLEAGNAPGSWERLSVSIKRRNFCSLSFFLLVKASYTWRQKKCPRLQNLNRNSGFWAQCDLKLWDFDSMYMST